MEIEKQVSAAGSRMSISGEVTIVTSAKLQAALCKALAGGNLTVLDLEGVTEIDLAGLQVLVAAERSFRASRVALETHSGQIVRNAWSEAGFPHNEVSDGEDNHDGR